MAGGLATAVLADFGAEVVKIEPPAGDPFRSYPAWLAWNRGKKSAVLDLKSAEGRRQAQRLAERADVVIESFRPGVGLRLGIDYAGLAAINPRLVYASISGWGQQGPLSQVAGYEGVVAAKSGRMASFEGQMNRAGPAYAAVQVGTWAASQAAVRGILAALFARDAHGRGQWVQTSLLQNMIPYDLAGARFQSLSGPWANTTTHAGKLIMTVFAGIAEFERDLIRERTSAGREAAKRRGIHFGRPRKLNPEQTKLACRLIDEGQSVKQIADTFNVHTATIYRLSATTAA
jgi:crotonobetainyl-CoA:carnitine CoA-transferase CaiB-like acyl-CoA transferase